jgi:hypothetical protein
LVSASFVEQQPVAELRERAIPSDATLMRVLVLDDAVLSQSGNKPLRAMTPLGVVTVKVLESVRGPAVTPGEYRAVAYQAVCGSDVPPPAPGARSWYVLGRLKDGRRIDLLNFSRRDQRL